MLEIIYIIIALGLTILVHEVGHFATAKKMGITVEKFSIGWGPKIASFTKNGTEYAISWLVFLGGYVKLAGEHPDEFDEKDENGFLNQHPFKKIIVSVSGVILNIVFAVFLMWVVFIAGTDTLKPQVGSVKKGYPAYAAGIQKGDIITVINGKKIRYWSQLNDAIVKNGEKEISITVLRAGKEIDFKMVPKIEETEDIIKDKKKRPFVGISPVTFLPVVEDLKKGYPAESAGLKKGDRITEINGKRIVYWEDLLDAVEKNGEKQAVIKAARNGEEKIFRITPKMEETAEESGKKTNIPMLGIIPAGNVIKERYNPVEAAARAVNQTIFFTALTVRAIYKMIARKIEPDVAGPIGVVHITYKVAKTGVINLLLLFAIININLALVNFLPLLPLDGGLTLMFVIEWIKGSPVSLKVQEVLMQFGWAFIIFLLIFFTYNDILRIFKGGF